MTSDSGRSSGMRAKRLRSNSVAVPVASIWCVARCTRPSDSSASGVVVSEMSVTRRSPTATSERAEPTSDTRPIRTPPEPVTGFCILPRAATMARTCSLRRSGT